MRPRGLGSLLHFQLPLACDYRQRIGRWIGQRDDVGHLVHGAPPFEQGHTDLAVQSGRKLHRGSAAVV
jgi:hypothetical protein